MHISNLKLLKQSTGFFKWVRILCYFESQMNIHLNLTLWLMSNPQIRYQNSLCNIIYFFIRFCQINSSTSVLQVAVIEVDNWYCSKWKTVTFCWTFSTLFYMPLQVLSNQAYTDTNTGKYSLDAICKAQIQVYYK